MPSTTEPSTPEQAPIPIVDFSRFLHGTPAERQDVAAQLDATFRTAGFVHLTNHGVPQDKVDECFEWSARFFELPEATKVLAPHPPGGSHHRGYSAPGLEKVSQKIYDSADISALRQIPDVKESFDAGNPLDTHQPNIWPPPGAALPGFQPFLEEYFTHFAALVHALLRALALALNLPDQQHLSAAHGRSLFQLRLLRYPPVALRALRDGSKARIGAHSDFGTLTLLWQDRVGGLEVEEPGREGVFRGVRGVRGAVLVNVGDLLERWSNGRWRSTVHRVRAPPAAGGGAGGGEEEGEEMCRERYSIPFFATADSEAVVEALPGTWGEGRPKRWEPVTAGEYIRMRMATLY